MNSFGGVFIKIKIKGYLKNITQNEVEKIDTSAIKNNSNITYTTNNTIHKITIKDNIIKLSRNNEKFSNEIIFELNKEYNTEYYIKDLKANLDFKVKTNKIMITDQKIEIKYQIIDSKDEYEYLIEMSD